MAGRYQQNNFYAISSGGCPPCITTSWFWTIDHVSGCSRSKYKGFESLAEAKAWLLAEMCMQDGSQTFHFLCWPTDGPKNATRQRNEPAVFYAVASGRRTGVYNDWNEAEAQVRGYPGAMHRGFATREAAELALEASRASQRLQPVTVVVQTDDDTTTEDELGDALGGLSLQE